MIIYFVHFDYVFVFVIHIASQSHTACYCSHFSAGGWVYSYIAVGFVFKNSFSFRLSMGKHLEENDFADVNVFDHI